MSAALIALLAVVCVALVAVIARQRRGHERIAASDERILFPFAGQSLSERTLEAALRLARAEHATLVPAYLGLVPLHLPLDTPLPAECDNAMPLLETFEQRAASQHVAVDSRIAAGRTYRHALGRLFERERFDRIVVAAASEGTEGFSADDVAWLLEHAPGEVVALRPVPKSPSPQPRGLARRRRGAPHPDGVRTARR